MPPNRNPCKIIEQTESVPKCCDSVESGLKHIVPALLSTRTWKLKILILYFTELRLLSVW